MKKTNRFCRKQNKEWMPVFAQRLKELRKQNGLSQASLAQQLGMTQQAVGKWERGTATPDPQTIAKLAEIFNVPSDVLLGLDAGGIRPYSSGQEFLVPILGTVRAGYGLFAEQEELGREYARVKDPESYFYLEVKGDSMEPRICEGDLALVHRQNTLNSGDLGVVVFGEGEGTLKKYVIKGDTVVLQPFNPAYPPQILTGEDLNSLFIAGKVVQTIRRW